MNAVLESALSAFQSGDMETAASLSGQLLLEDPAHFAALVLQGLIARQRGDLELALHHLERAVAADPDSADALAHQAGVLSALQRYELAVSACEAALVLRPDFKEVIFNMANALRALDHHEQALSAYERLLNLQPEDAGALNNRGVCLARLGRHAEALDSFARALMYRPDYPEAFNNRGISLGELGFQEEAVESFQRALMLRPDYPQALNNLGHRLAGQGQSQAALECHQRAHELLPEPEQLFHLANVLQTLRRHDDALECFDQILLREPDHVEVLNNRGNSLQALNRHAAAARSYQRAIAIRPEDAEAHWNEALARLALGDYRGGFERYEWRLRNPRLQPVIPPLDVPAWTGAEDLSDKRLLLYQEQGMGDAIQFSRFAALAVARGAQVHILCHESLRRVFSTLEGVHQVHSQPDQLPAMDMQASIMSLGLLFKITLRRLIPFTPWLRADPGEVIIWKERFESAGGALRAGLVWAGNPDFPDAISKTCPAEAVLPLLKLPGIRWYSLQKYAAAQDLEKFTRAACEFRDCSDWLHDFAATAAAIENLDVVVTVDTAVAHLAGAMGKPVWILLPWAADWRWLVSRTDSPWYASARLFRQPAAGAWPELINQVSDALAVLASVSGGAEPVPAIKEFD
jgi:tetratricopeptide (TPR) repeat protein